MSCCCSCHNPTVLFRVPEKNFTLPKGRYLVTDPCYIFEDNETWHKVCDFFFPKMDPNPRGRPAIIMNTAGHDVYMWGTRHGDGVYPVYRSSKRIGQCGVDAGCLSFVHEDVMKAWNVDRDYLGCWAEIKKDAIVCLDNGNVKVGAITVMTDNWTIETIRAFHKSVKEAMR